MIRKLGWPPGAQPPAEATISKQTVEPVKLVPNE